MLADLICCTEAMPQNDAVALDVLLEGQGRSIPILAIRMGLFAIRGTIPNVSVDRVLTHLAGLDSREWQSVRDVLLSLRDDVLELRSSPIAAVLSVLVTEVDGRRLENAIEVEAFRVEIRDL